MTALRAEGCGIALRAMSIKPALRDLRLCLHCCIAKSQSPFPRKGGRRQAPEEQCGLDVRSQRSDVKRRCVLAFPPPTRHPERQRRISVKIDSVSTAAKYRSAGRSRYRRLSPFGTCGTTFPSASGGTAMLNDAFPPAFNRHPGSVSRQSEGPSKFLVSP